MRSATLWPIPAMAVARMGDNPDGPIVPTRAGWDQWLNAMIDRVLAPGGIGNEEVITSTAQSRGEISFGASRLHTDQGDEPASAVARRAILGELSSAVAQLKRVEAMMQAEGLLPEADSLATVIADLHWQSEELDGR